MRWVAAALALLLLLPATSADARMHYPARGHRIVPASVGPLDGFAAPAAAYSLRKLRSAYSGPGVRLRRTTGGTQDINFLGCTGFTGCPLDVAAAAAFCNATTCFIDTWYDQSGNGRHLTQATAANQLAYIADCGDGQPCARETTAVQQMVSGSVAWAAAKTTLSLVVQRTAGPTVRCYYLGRGGSFVAAQSVSGQWVMTDFVTEFSTAASESAWHAGLGLFDGAASVLRVDAAEATGTEAGSAAASTVQVFANGAAGTTCNIREAVVWDNYGLTPAERAVWQGNQKSFWGTL